jgi:hypothetical protein
MRKYATTFLIAATLLIGELHTFWERSPYMSENWIYAVERPMPLQWNVKLASDQLNFILFAFALFLYVPNRANRSTAITLVCYAFLDTIAYFYNYKTFGYGLIYLILAGIWNLSFFWHKNSTNIK